MTAPGCLFTAPGLAPVWVPHNAPVTWAIDEVAPESSNSVYVETVGRCLHIADARNKAEAERLRLSAARAFARGEHEWSPEMTRTSTDAEVVGRVLAVRERLLAEKAESLEAGSVFRYDRAAAFLRLIDEALDDRVAAP